MACTKLLIMSFQDLTIHCEATELLHSLKLHKNHQQSKSTKPKVVLESETNECESNAFG